MIVKEGARSKKFYILNEGNARILKEGEQIGDQSAGERSSLLSAAFK